MTDHDEAIQRHIARFADYTINTRAVQPYPPEDVAEALRDLVDRGCIVFDPITQQPTPTAKWHAEMAAERMRKAWAGDDS